VLAYVLPLFDLSYRRIPLERVCAVIQVVFTFGLIYSAAELAAYGFSVSITRGMLHLFLVGPMLLVGGLAILRAALIFLLALVRVADHMEGLDRIAGNMEELGDLPRWVRGLSPLRRLLPSGEPGRRVEGSHMPE
jgi:hypothetical protein